MKKTIIMIVITLVIALLIVVYAFFLRRTPYTISEIFTGYKIPKTLSIVQFKDEWNQNGDGESFIIFTIPSKEQLKLENNCIQKQYDKLPIKEDLPDNFIYNYINKTDSLGYYHLNVDKSDNRNYSVVILNLNEHKLLIYNVIN